MKIFLIGFMGSGKSYWARALSKSLDLPLIEMDEEIEKETGLKIAGIFDQHGENYFRKLEHKLLLKIIEKEQYIVSCGGGLPCHEDNMDLMNKYGLTIWLNPSVAVMAERLKRKKYKRPLIKDLDDDQLIQFIEKKLEERKSFYAKAKLIIDPLSDSVETFTKKIKTCKELI